MNELRQPPIEQSQVEPATKVLQVISELNVGGMETQLLSLAAHIDRKRFDFSVCCIGNGRLVEQFQRIGIKVFVVDKNSGGLGIRPTLSMLRVFRKCRPDIVHCQGVTAGIRGHLCAKLMRVPVLIKSYHGLNLWKRGMLIPVDRWLSQYTDKYVLVSNARRQLLTEREHIPARSSTVIYNGIDHRRFTPRLEVAHSEKLRLSMGLPADACCVGTVGSLTPVKNQRMFLKAAQLVRQSLPNVHFAIVGGGRLRAVLEQDVQTMQLSDNVHFFGIRHDIPQILQLFDLFAMCSLQEDLSMAILEAMSAGLPVVATDVGGNRELICDGQTGYIVASDDAAAMAQRILSLATDPKMRAAMGRSARRRIEQSFSAEANARTIENLYKSCLR